MFDRNRSIWTVEDLLSEHRARLRSLVGQRIAAVWVAWDVARDEWFADEAVIVEVGDTSLEIVCWKLNEIVLSWREIDKRQPPGWVAEWGDEFHLEWRRDGIPSLRDVVERRIVGLNVVEYLHRTTVVADRQNPGNVGRRHENWLLHGLEFELEGAKLEVFNGLDQNGVGQGSFVGEDFRRIGV